MPVFEICSTLVFPRCFVTPQPPRFSCFVPACLTAAFERKFVPNPRQQQKLVVGKLKAHPKGYSYPPGFDKPTTHQTESQGNDGLGELVQR